MTEQFLVCRDDNPVGNAMSSVYLSGRLFRTRSNPENSGGKARILCGALQNTRLIGQTKIYPRIHL